ncbi:MAG: hypothetical protein V2A54_14535 [Bacteroidota bacterium]
MQENNNHNSLGLIAMVYKWRIHILILVAIAIVASIVFSGSRFITPKYKSFAVVYPANLESYSDESPTEQLLQMFRSDDIRNGIIQKFKLVSHYRIDTNANYYYTSLIREYESNIKVSKTEFESVNIEVMDSDPEIAYRIVYAMIELVNKKIRELHREKVGEAVKSAKAQMDRKKVQMDSLEIIQREMSVKYGFMDYTMQVKEASRAQFTGLVNKGSSNYRVDTLIRNLQSQGGFYIAINDLIWKERGNFNDLKAEYQKQLSLLEQELTYTSLVIKPLPADKKAYPVRWLIVVIAAVSTLFLSILLVGFFERYRSFMKMLKSRMTEEKAEKK